MKRLSFFLSFAVLLLTPQAMMAQVTHVNPVNQPLSTQQKTTIQDFFPEGVTLFHLPQQRQLVEVGRLHEAKASQIYFLYNALPQGKALSWRVSMFSEGYLPPAIHECESAAQSPLMSVSVKGRNWSLCDNYLYANNAQHSVVIYLYEAKVKKLYPNAGAALKRALVSEIKRYSPQKIAPLPGGSWAQSIQRLQPLDRLLAFRASDYILQSTGISWQRDPDKTPLVEFSYRHKTDAVHHYDVDIYLFKPNTRLEVDCETSSAHTQRRASVLNHPTLGAYKVCTLLQKKREYYADPKVALFYPQTETLNNLALKISFKDKSNAFPPLAPILAAVKKLSD